MYRDTETMLRYEAKRSPDLAAMIDNIDSMTTDAIESVKVKMPWMRLALLELKRKSELKQTALDLERFVVDSVNPDPMGETRRWTGQTTYIRIGKRRALLEIKPGQLIWSNGNGVWIDTIFSEIVDPALSQTEAYGTMTRLAYLNTIRDQLRKLTVPHTQISSVPNPPSDMFTIFRPG